MIILQQQQQSMLGMFLPLILIIGVILISIDAKKRGMNPFIWVLLVIFTVGIAIIPYFIFRKPKNEDKKYKGGLNERIGKR